ncbi:MAG: DUF1700 domain-containing protein [Eubacteriales bacterium]|nr:DUF1700 domain-containing protein [Eubacteriales bacterium]
MNKNDFLSELERALKENKVTEREDILSEYEEHFRFKLADGYSEEEIAAKLGNPTALAKQFEPNTSENVTKTGNRLIAVIGLGFADIIIAMVFVMLFAWVISMAVITIALFTTGICLIADIDIYEIIPAMPYVNALLFGIFLLAMSMLSYAGTVYCGKFVRQLMRAYGRFHENVLAASKNEPVYPSLPMYPKFNRKLRKVALVSLIICAVSFITTYIVSAICAGSLEFWHVWNWFE